MHLFKDHSTGEAQEVTTIVDITEQERAAEELRLAKETAEAAAPRAPSSQHEPRDSHAHERRHRHDHLLLETPLTPGAARIPRDGRSSGESLLTIINDILDFSKIEAGRLDWSIDSSCATGGRLDLRPAARGEGTGTA